MQETNVNDIAIRKLREYLKLTKCLFIRVNEMVISIDELRLGKDVSISTEVYKEDCPIIEIIEKRPILNDKISMEEIKIRNFDTYVARYAINFHTDSIERLEDKILSRTIDIDVCSNTELKYWTIRTIGDKYKTIIIKRGIEERFKSLSEAKAVISKIISAVNYEDMLYELSSEQLITFKEMLSEKLYTKVEIYLEEENEKRNSYKRL